jgi:ABC-2 type transport system permease protein
MRHHLKIYGNLLALQLRVRIAYETSFWVGMIGIGLLNVSGMVVVWALVQQVATIAGWSLWEIAFLYGLTLLPRGLGDLLGEGVWGLRYLINQGEFERMLLRPLSPFFQVTTYSLVSMYGLGNTLVGGLLLWRAAHALHLMGDVSKLVLLISTLTSATLMFILLGFLTNVDVFWNHSPQSSVPSLVHELLEFTKFPLPIYQRSLQFLLTWLLPFALVSYYPSLVLLGKTGAAWWLVFSAPLATLGMGLISSWVWRCGLVRYQGVGQ